MCYFEWGVCDKNIIWHKELESDDKKSDSLIGILVTIAEYLQYTKGIVYSLKRTCVAKCSGYYAKYPQVWIYTIF